MIRRNTVSVSDNAPEYDIVDPTPNRERGVLTPHDRAFLRAGADEGVRADMSASAKRQKRHKIRSRFENALIDIQYLLLLEDADLKQLFDGDKWTDEDRARLFGAAQAAVYNLGRTHVDRYVVIDGFEKIVEHDILREHAHADRKFVLPTVELVVEEPPEDEHLPLEAVRAVLDSGRELPYQAHMALDCAGLHPNPEEYFSDRFTTDGIGE